MVSATELVEGKTYKRNGKCIGKYQEKKEVVNTPSSNPDAPPPDPAKVTYYYFEGPPGYDATARYAVSENQLSSVEAVDEGATCAVQGGRRRRRTRRMMFKKWAAQEAREMSHKGKRMTFRKWAAHELKEKSHPGNPSFKKWARQEMREKSHTRRRR